MWLTGRLVPDHKTIADFAPRCAVARLLGAVGGRAGCSVRQKALTLAERERAEVLIQVPRHLTTQKIAGCVRRPVSDSAAC
jgi:hypothetical protein